MIRSGITHAIGGSVNRISRRFWTETTWNAARSDSITTADGHVRRQLAVVVVAADAACSADGSVYSVRHASSLAKRSTDGQRDEGRDRSEDITERRANDGAQGDEGHDRLSGAGQQHSRDNGLKAMGSTTPYLPTAAAQPARTATLKRTKHSRSSVGNGRTVLTLEHFLLRDKGFKLWRDFLRATRNIPNPSARRETIDWLRDEHFEGPLGLRQQTDLTRIRDSLLAGNVALKRICGPMELAAALNPVHGAFPKLVGRRGLSVAS